MELSLLPLSQNIQREQLQCGWDSGPPLSGKESDVFVEKH